MRDRSIVNKPSSANQMQVCWSCDSLRGFVIAVQAYLNVGDRKESTKCILQYLFLTVIQSYLNLYIERSEQSYTPPGVETSEPYTLAELS